MERTITVEYVKNGKTNYLILEINHACIYCRELGKKFIGYSIFECVGSIAVDNKWSDFTILK